MWWRGKKGPRCWPEVEVVSPADLSSASGQVELQEATRNSRSGPSTVQASIPPRSSPHLGKNFDSLQTTTVSACAASIKPSLGVRTGRICTCRPIDQREYGSRGSERNVRFARTAAVSLIPAALSRLAHALEAPYSSAYLQRSGRDDEPGKAASRRPPLGGALGRHSTRLQRVKRQWAQRMMRKLR